MHPAAGVSVRNIGRLHQRRPKARSSLSTSSAPSEDGEDCTCHFNKLHIIWIVFVSLAFIALVVLAVIFGLKFWKVFSAERQQQQMEAKMEARRVRQEQTEADHAARDLAAEKDALLGFA